MRPSGRHSALGDYDVVKVIASGGMGTVLEVRSRRTGATYAAKTILKVGDTATRARFQREAELLARCDRHPGIVKVHAIGETPEGAPYMILDLVAGESLEKLIAREAPLEPRRAARIARDLASALGFVHALGVVHRDVKPSNVLLDATAEGAPRLTDFGIATARDLERLTKTGAVVGTLVYCSPEQATGGAIGPPADVFALGSVLFEMLAGRPPLTEATTLRVLQELSRAGEFPDVRTLAPGVSFDLAAIVARAIAKDPAARHPDGAALAAELDAFLEGRPVPSAERAAAVRRRRVKVLGAILGLGALVVATALSLAWRARRQLSAAASARSELTIARAALAAVSSGGSVDEPRRHLALARAQAALAGSERSALEAELAALDDELLLAEVEALIGRGEPEDALAHLGTDARTARARLLRARALVAARRAAEIEAALDAVALPADAPSAQRAELAELRGDALRAKGDSIAARGAYTRALAARDSLAVHAKRGALAAAAGDDPAALADFAAMVPDASKLPHDRAANAALEPYSLPLYRRGLAEKDARTAEPWIAAAYRIAAPPAALVPALVRQAEDVMHDSGAVLLLELGASATLTRQCAADMGLVMAGARRIAELEGAEQEPVETWQALGLIRHWLDVRGNHHMDELARAVECLDAEWPEQPTAIYAKASLRWRTEPREGLELACRAARVMPPPRAGDPDALAHLAQGIVDVAFAACGVGELDEATLAPIDALVAARCDRDHQLNFRLAHKFCRESPDTRTFEVERMSVVSCSGGATFRCAENLEWSRYCGRRWSEGARGARLVLAFDSTLAGRHRLQLFHARGREFADFTVSLNGGPPVSVVGYNERFEHAGVALEGDLVAGRNELVLTITGHHPEALPDFTVGLDVLVVLD